MAEFRSDAVQRDALVIVLGQDGFEVGELSGELARGEQARTDAEEKSGVVFGELDGFGVGGIEQGLEFVHRFFGDEGFHLAGDAFEFFSAALAVSQAVTVGGDHGDRLGLEQH